MPTVPRIRQAIGVDKPSTSDVVARRQRHWEYIGKEPMAAAADVDAVARAACRTTASLRLPHECGGDRCGGQDVAERRSAP